ncbi:hypothetical protein Msi02_76970 [Microbispora siamensis]|uniref:Benzoate-CoA ligase family protein n=1 Tax=Microbispora siamensis TaxID=564413 RepID=A0ABQ4GZV0_9ACTN|nr:hypothetical protein Msi02_76970 [Microbispora siamensis]
MCISSGEALPLELHRRWLDTFGVELIDGIGSSEMFHGYVCNRPGRVRMGSLGEAVPGYRVRVVDRDGNEVPDGEVGRLEITGETAALGYWREPDKSAATFVAEHTVRSSDLFSRDADGYFHYKGRADDMLRIGGRWVAPAEVENCLLAHPRVVECAVSGHEDGGLTVLRAFVVIGGEATGGEVTSDELREFVKERLAPYKCPREFRFVTALPQTSNGKLDRTTLRNLS